MSDPNARQAGAILSAQALQEFERLFLAWLDRYQDRLELGGIGNASELATLCAAWVSSRACDLGQMIPVQADEFGSDPEGHQAEHDTDRLSRLIAEIDRHSELHSATRIAPSP
jgi:hypothetical protein